MRDPSNVGLTLAFGLKGGAHQNHALACIAIRISPSARNPLQGAPVHAGEN
jgi:hypothetical protein